MEGRGGGGTEGGGENVRGVEPDELPIVGTDGEDVGGVEVEAGPSSGGGAGM